MKSFIKKALYVLFRQIKGPQRKERIPHREVGPKGTTLSEEDLKDDEKISGFIIFVVKDKRKFTKLLTQKNIWEKYVIPILPVIAAILSVVAAIIGGI